MPGNISSILQEVLSGVTGGKNAEILFYRPVGGGSINETDLPEPRSQENNVLPVNIDSIDLRSDRQSRSFEIYTKSNKRWFCKFNDATRFPGLFIKEARGLSLLHRQGRMRVPEVVACNEVGDRQILVLEWIEQGPRSPAFWKLFGEQLAHLHQVSGTSFGLDENNYMGALPQDNTPVPASPPDSSVPWSNLPVGPSQSCFSRTSWPDFPPASWPDFMIQRRLLPQIRLAADHGLLDPAAIRHFERLYPVLPGIFGEPESPSLLHGDLWSGNFLCDDGGHPVLIDPAVYYGHRCMDLAMTTLFGGFEPAFYESYAYHHPLPANYREQWDIANLYPLLIHLNLFGKSYLGNILHTIQRF